MQENLRVWDLPIRLFHWLLVLAVFGALATGFMGQSWMEWHGRFGLTVAGLLGFRLAWGVMGSTYVRFWAILRAPLAILDYLRGQWHGLGHNPLGSLSVMAILALLIFQVGSGLVSTNDITFNGPLYPLVSYDISSMLTGWHRLCMWLVIAIICLHILSILFYALVKKHNLVRPMITGVTPRQFPEQKAATGGGPVAFIVALIFAALVIWLVSGTWIAPSPPLVDPGW